MAFLFMGQKGGSEEVEVTYVGGHSTVLIVNSYGMHVRLKGKQSVSDINNKVEDYVRKKLYSQGKIPSISSSIKVATEWYYYNTTTDETEAGVQVIITFSIETAGGPSDTLYYPEEIYLSSILEQK